MAAMSVGKLKDVRTWEDTQGEAPSSLSPACAGFPRCAGWCSCLKKGLMQKVHTSTYDTVSFAQIPRNLNVSKCRVSYNTGKPILIMRHFCSSHFSPIFFPRSNVPIPLKPDWIHRNYTQQILAQTSKMLILTETHLSSMNASKSWS